MTATRSGDRDTLVLGGRGTTGRRVAERLAAAGGVARIGSRTGTPRFDWDDEATWEPALRGVGAVFLTYPTDLGLPGAAERVEALATAAVSDGVGRLVLLSGRGQHSHASAERAVRESGAEWTIVRSAWFAQNFSEGFLAGMVRDGSLALPAGDAAEPFVDAVDVAEVVVAALSGGGHAGEVYELTGPDALTFAAAADEMARAGDRPVRYLAVSEAEFTTDLADAGVPAELVTVLGEVFAELRDGRNARPTDGVERALGRPPRDFPRFARDAVAAGAWGPP